MTNYRFVLKPHFRGRNDRAIVSSAENLPTPVGFVDATIVPDKIRDADPTLIIKVFLLDCLLRIKINQAFY